MKTVIILTVLFVGLSVQLNGVDGIFWEFIKPFVPSHTVYITSSTPSSSSSNSSSGATPSQVTSMTVGDLNNSSAVLALNSNVTTNFSNVTGP